MVRLLSKLNLRRRGAHFYIWLASNGALPAFLQAPTVSFDLSLTGRHFAAGHAAEIRGAGREGYGLPVARPAGDEFRRAGGKREPDRIDRQHLYAARFGGT